MDEKRELEIAVNAYILSTGKQILRIQKKHFPASTTTRLREFPQPGMI